MPGKHIKFITENWTLLPLFSIHFFYPVRSSNKNFLYEPRRAFQPAAIFDYIVLWFPAATAVVSLNNACCFVWLVTYAASNQKKDFNTSFIRRPRNFMAFHRDDDDDGSITHQASLKKCVPYSAIMKNRKSGKTRGNHFSMFSWTRNTKL